MNAVMGQIRWLVGPDPGERVSDGELLRQFSKSGGSPRGKRAFAAVVQRHGRTVWAVCRAILGDSPDAEDAFQATFLVLARKARSLRGRRGVGQWLVGVAWRLSKRQTVDRAKRRVREKEARRKMEQDDVATVVADEETRRIIHEEIGRLNPKFGKAVLLRHISGISVKEMAEILDCTPAAAKKRAERGREMLKERLARRGIGLDKALSVLSSVGKGAPVHVREVSALAEAAASFAASGSVPAGSAAAAAAKLAEEALKSMLRVHVARLTVVVVLSLLLAGAGTAALYRALSYAGSPAGSASVDGPVGDLPQNPVQVNEGRVLVNGMNAFCVAFRPDGKQLAIGKAKGLLCWVDLVDLDTDHTTRLPIVTAARMNQTGVRALAYSPDGRRLAAGTRDGMVYLWDLSQAQPTRESWKAHGEVVKGIAFRPDGQALASSGDDGALKLWPVVGEKRELLSHPLGAKLDDVKFSGNGLLACGSAKKLWIFSAASLEAPGHGPVEVLHEAGDFRKFSFSSNGRRLAVNRGHGLVLFRVAGSELQLERVFSDPSLDGPASGDAHGDEITCVDLSPDGALVATGGGDRQLKLWDASSGQLIKTIVLGGEGNIFPRFAPEGDRLAVTGNDTCVLYELSR
jgi:RNA polymerase sigma factor (sigma-70 family)